MIEALVRPDKETYPLVKRWTVEECAALAEKGHLTGRYELIYGVIYLKMPMNPPHRIALRLLSQWLVALFGYLYIQTEDPIALPGEDGKTTQPEPDAAVTHQPTTAYTESNPGPSDLRLVAEVSDTTLDFDLNVKAPLYARVGIPEYLVLDVAGRKLHRHRSPNAAGYGEIVALGENDHLMLLDRMETIRVGELLPAKG